MVDMNTVEGDSATTSSKIVTISYVETYIYPDVGGLSKVYPVVSLEDPLHMTIHVSSYLSTHFGNDIANVILEYANDEQADLHVVLYCPKSRSITFPDFENFTICVVMVDRCDAVYHVDSIISERYGVKNSLSLYPEVSHVYDDENDINMAYYTKAPGSYLIFQMTNPNPKFT